MMYYNFRYNPASLKKERTSSMLMFSNRSLILSALKCRSMAVASTPHSIRICLIVWGIWHVKHCGGCSCLRIKEWVSLVWPICGLDIITCSILDFWNAGHHSPKVGLIWKSLLLMLSFQHCYHFVTKNLFICGFKSVYGMLVLSGLRSKADFAAESALSLPLTSMWLGIQHMIISLWLDIKSSLFSSLIIKGFPSILFFNDVNMESESENMIYLLYLFFDIISRARAMAQISAVKMELSLGRPFLRIILLRTAAHAVLSFEPSVNIY